MVDLIEKLAAIFADSRVVRTINNGLIQLIPFILIGTIAIAVISLPIPAYQEILESLFGGMLLGIFQVVSYATIGAIAVAALLSVSYSYAIEEPSIRTHEIHPMIPVFASFNSYLIVCVWKGDIISTFSNIEIILTNPGQTGIFVALALALTTSWVFFAFVKLWSRITLPRLSALDTNLSMRSTFRAVLPLVSTVAVFALLRICVIDFFPTEAIIDAFRDFVMTNLATDDPFSIILMVGIMQVLWFFGIHGTSAMLSGLPSVADLTASNAATSMPMFATSDFYLNFISLGGSGATLGLLIALLIVGPKHRDKHLAKASLFPSIFNINEIFLYGIPIILNPFFIIPFILAPMLIASLSYLAFSLALVPPIIYSVNWTTPIILSGYLSTGSIAGALLQLFGLIVSVLLYVPFILSLRSYDSRQRASRIAELQSAVEVAADNEAITVFYRNDRVGETAREVSSRLYSYFETDTVPLSLVYQPKTDCDGHVMGAEALLRWEHSEFGTISPTVVVELCDENGLTTQLGRWITKTAIAERARWQQLDIGPIRLSINLNPAHLVADPVFPEFLAELMESYGVSGDEIELEITEHVAVHASKATRKSLRAIRELGVELSIDDMGMGYSSLTYISDYGVKGVKIDTSLVSEITTDVQQAEIVRSIVQLATQLQLTVIVEGVETQDQVDALTALGVQFFQGYRFSRPLPPTDFITFVADNGVYSA